MADEWLTVQEAMRRLRLGRNTVYNLARRGELPSRKFGRQLRIPASALERWATEAADRAA